MLALQYRSKKCSISIPIFFQFYNSHGRVDVSKKIGIDIGHFFDLYVSRTDASNLPLSWNRKLIKICTSRFLSLSLFGS